MDFDIIKAKKVLIHAVMEAEVKSIISCVPPAGPFRSVCWALEYPECPHEGRLYTQHSTEHGCAIRASMIVDGTDREVSDFSSPAAKVNASPGWKMPPTKNYSSKFTTIWQKKQTVCSDKT